MKFFIGFTLLAAVVALGTCSSASSGSDTIKDLETEPKTVQNSQLNNEYNRFKKSANYGDGSAGIAPHVQPPPCPKNYLFSCQPSLTPVPCIPGGPGRYGPMGAFSAPVPTYMAPLGNTYGVPQGYDGFAPQNFNNFYQY